MTVQIHGKDIYGDDRYLNSGLEFDEMVITDFTNWETHFTNTGEASKEAHKLRIHTGATANSIATCYCSIFNTVDFEIPAGYGFFDISATIGWVIGMEDSVATSKTYLVYGLQYTASDPTLKSFGFRIDNLAAKGIVHNGTSLTVVDLSTTLTPNSVFRLKAVFTAGDKIEWFINGVSKGSSTSIPSGTFETGCYKLSAQTTNGATATSQAMNCYKATYQQKTWG